MRSDFGLLGCILNIDSPENRLAECSVRFIYIQHRAALSWLFGDGQAVDSACASKEVIANFIWLFGCAIWHYRRQESSFIPRDCKKRLHGSSDLFRSQEAERILLSEIHVDSEFDQSVPKRGSYYLVNNFVRSRNHTMSVTLNLGAVRIIWPACKPVHILYLEPLHSQVR